MQQRWEGGWACPALPGYWACQQQGRWGSQWVGQKGGVEGERLDGGAGAGAAQGRTDHCGTPSPTL